MSVCADPSKRASAPKIEKLKKCCVRSLPGMAEKTNVPSRKKWADHPKVKIVCEKIKLLRQILTRNDRKNKCPLAKKVSWPPKSENYVSKTKIIFSDLNPENVENRGVTLHFLGPLSELYHAKRPNFLKSAGFQKVWSFCVVQLTYRNIWVIFGTFWTFFDNFLDFLTFLCFFVQF